MTDPLTIGRVLPYAIPVGANGVLTSKGLVNSREHLESLVKSMDLSVESIQDCLYAEPGMEKTAS